MSEIISNRREGRPLLDGKIYAEFSRGDGTKHVGALCLKLLAQQKETWPLLRNGYASVERSAQRRVLCGGFSVVVQHNPGRIKSTLAAVGEDDIGKRPCFLCLNHLPQEQKGVLYSNEYLILCNPMPVFPAHFTIARIEHRPQAIIDHMDTLMQLTTDFGSGWAILYNGPKCGASAPDHHHFQAVPSGLMPIEKEICGKRRLTMVEQSNRVARLRANSMGREVIIIEGSSPAAVGKAFEAFHTELKSTLGINEEPMMNVIGLYGSTKVMGQGSRVIKNSGCRHPTLSLGHERPHWRFLIFPRSKHRPDSFFKTGSERIAVSPAVVEMGGIFVTPFERDFHRLDAASIESIYGEVSLYSTSS